jgi:hypothetical protein
VGDGETVKIWKCENVKMSLTERARGRLRDVRLGEDGKMRPIRERKDQNLKSKIEFFDSICVICVICG